MDSILGSVRQAMGMQPDYKHFDSDLILHINTVMLTLNQLGVGPEDGFFISNDDAKWIDLLGDRKDIEAVKTLVYLKVKMLFDPPTHSFVIEATERQINQLEWRINAQVDKPPVVEGGIEDGS